MYNDPNSAGEYFNNFMNQLVEGLPRFLGAVAIIIIGYFVAKLIASIVHNLLGRAQFNQQLHSGKGGNFIQRALPDPMGLLSRITYWMVFLFSISIAVSVLGIPVLVDIVRAIYAYIPNIIAALLIFLVAGSVPAGVVTLVTNAMGDTPTGKIISTAAPLVIMGIAVFMILNQLRIAPEIVTITYAAILGSTALGMALAFGLGGREVASKMLQDMYEKGKQHKTKVTSDFKQGAQKAQSQAEEIRLREQL